MKVAVIGAGWAGLAAAVRAADLGHDITLFEASHTLGGRARAVDSPRLNSRIDNGQHIMLGAYQATLDLMQRLGIDTHAVLQREPLTLESADGHFRIAVPRLPKPLHLLGGLIGAKGLQLKNKWELLQCMRTLQHQNWSIMPDTTVQDWLDRQHQSERVRSLFWHPLCIAALNTPVTQASAQLFANVLRDSVGGSPEACEIVLARVDLSSLWPDRVAELTWPTPGGSLEIRRGSVVTHLEIDVSAADHDTDDMASSGLASGGVRVQDEKFDAVIVAGNAPSVHRLLGTLSAPTDRYDAVKRLMKALESFRYIPIATVTLQLAKPWSLPRSMYQLHEDRAAKQYGQWLFNCSAFMRSTPICNSSRPDPLSGEATSALLHIVISDASQALAEGRDALAQAIERQVRLQTHRFGTMPDVTGYELIAEKRATFAAVPGLERAGASSPWPQIWLAGDWTDTGYPAVLEGAVRSGQNAALQLHQAMAGH